MKIYIAVISPLMTTTKILHASKTFDDCDGLIGQYLEERKDKHRVIEGNSINPVPKQFPMKTRKNKVMRKENRNFGKEYTIEKGKLTKARSMTPLLH